MDHDIIFEKYLLSAYQFLNYQPRSEKEVRDNLKKKQTPDEIIEKIVEKLKERRFLNDLTFAQMWVDSRLRVKPRSQFVLKMELKQKGIAEDIIESVLHKAVNEGQSDIVQARTLVEKKIRRYKGMEKQVVYQKLGGVLARKGFSWDISKRVIDEVLVSLQPENDQTP